MSFTLIDYFNGFLQLKRLKQFSASVQSTYFAILAEFHLRHFPGELVLSTRDLKALAGLKSVASAHEARNILKNNKLVDFHTVNGISVYTLGTAHLPNTLPNTYRTPTEHQPNTNRTPDCCVCYTQKQAHAGTDEHEAATETPSRSPSSPALFPTPPIPPPPTPHLTPVNNNIINTPPTPPAAASAATHPSLALPLARALPLRSPIIQDPDDPNTILDIWEFETGYTLTGSAALELEMLAAKEYERVHDAIVKAVKASKGCVTFNYFKAIFDNRQPQQQQTKKGGKQSESGYDYDKPPAVNFDD